jgi:hypothetical protein
MGLDYVYEGCSVSGTIDILFVFDYLFGDRMWREAGGRSGSCIEGGGIDGC